MTQTEQRPIVTVDAVLFTLSAGRLCIALQRRDREPFKGRPSLIGGYVRPDEDRDAAAAMGRILAEKAGLHGVFVEQLMTFTGRERDPRGWSASICYYALAPQEALFQAASSGTLELAPVEDLPELPFDHGHIVRTAMKRIRRKGAYSTLPALLLPAHFTLPELKAIYELVLGAPLNDSAFRRKVNELKLVEPVEEAKSPATAERKRPAQLYRLAAEGLAEFERTI